MRVPESVKQFSLVPLSALVLHRKLGRQAVASIPDSQRGERHDISLPIGELFA
jgi:hypothetical protein